MPFVVAFGPSIEIGAARLIARAFGALVPTSLVARATGATAASRCSRVGWGRVPDLVDLNLGRFNMRGDLFNFRSLWEFGQLVENNNEG